MTPNHTTSRTASPKRRAPALVRAAAVSLLALCAGADQEPAEQRLWRGNFATKAAPRQFFKVMTWNVERGLQLPGITAALERERPHLCLLQEVDLNARRTGRRNIAEELARRLELNYVFAAEFVELGQGSASSPAYQGQAILASLPLQGLRTIRFGNQSGYWRPRWFLPNWGVFQRRTGGRLALAAEIEAGGFRLVIYNVHLESREGEDLRLRQLEEVLADAGRYGPGAAIVVAGDLNTSGRDSPVITRLREAGFRDAIGGQSVTSKRGAVLDWIFVRGPAGFRDGAVHQDVQASDHYPLTVNLSLGKPGG
jgi:endonuclease/exonuclease/phosphatase family metal-dependent hydrolase